VTGAETEELQHEIERTREELGQTVEALAAKTDVKRQAKQRIDEAKASAAEKKSELLDKAKNLSPDTAAEVAAVAGEKARQNPIPLATVSAFAAGFVIGRLSRRG
jgi:chromosome segregation ATPase